MDDLNAKLHVGFLRDADYVVADVLAEARYRRSTDAAAARRWMSLVTTSATRRVNAHAHKHLRVVDDDLLPLVPRVRVAEVLDSAQPDSLSSIVVADRKRLVEEWRERTVTSTVACCAHAFSMSRPVESPVNSFNDSLIVSTNLNILEMKSV